MDKDLWIWVVTNLSLSTLHPFERGLICIVFLQGNRQSLNYGHMSSAETLHHLRNSLNVSNVWLSHPTSCFPLMIQTMTIVMDHCHGLL